MKIKYIHTGKSSDSDREICELLERRDQRGMDLLYIHYYKPLVLWANTFFNDLSVAEDVVQDFFIDIWEKKIYKKFRPEVLSGFLRLIVRNRCLNRKERRDVLADVLTLDKVELAWEEYNSQRDEILSRVMEEIRLFSPRTQLVLKYVFLDGMKYWEVAEELGVSVSTVKTLLGRAVHQLKERLGDRSWAQILLCFKRIKLLV